MFDALRSIPQIINSASSSTKLLGLVSVPLLLALGVVAGFLPREYLFPAYLVYGLLMVLLLAAMLLVEILEKSGDLFRLYYGLASGRSEAVNHALEALCHAIMIERDLNHVRAFVFLLVGQEFKCAYHWAQRLPDEVQTTLRVDIRTKDERSRIALLRAFDANTQIALDEPDILKAARDGVEGVIHQDLFYIRAIPIRNESEATIGMLTLDAVTPTGRELLKKPTCPHVVSKTAIYLRHVL